MALSKTIVASAGVIVANSGTSAATEDTYTFAGVPDVVNGVLKSTRQMRDPGVFTAGTAPEGTASNDTNDSNS